MTYTVEYVPKPPAISTPYYGDWQHLQERWMHHLTTDSLHEAVDALSTLVEQDITTRITSTGRR